MESYVQGVLSGKIPVCVYVRQAVMRHVRDLERAKSPSYPFEFSYAKAERFFKFTKNIKHYKGEYAGKYLELLPWQRFVLGSIYGWVEKKTGHFRFKECYLEVPRKQGKSFMAAAMSLYDMCFLEPTGAEVYIAATKLDQAKIVYKDVCAIIKANDKLSPHFQIMNGANVIFSRESQRTSFIKPLGSDSDRLDGLNPLSATLDEFHAFKDRNLYDVIKGAFGARKNYHIIQITTAGYNRDGVCYEAREQLVQILNGDIDNDRKFGIIYTLDKEDIAEWDNPGSWHKANPSLGCGKELGFMELEAKEAKQVPSKLNDFLTKQLNVWIDAKSGWLSMEDWKRAEETIQNDKLLGKTCYVGMDLARVNDLSALSLYFPIQNGIDKPIVKSIAYLPRDSVKTFQHESNFNLTESIAKGHLITTPGKTTDYDFILNEIKSLASKYNITITYDRYFSGELINSITKEGIRTLPYAQTTVAMNGPTLELERMLMDECISVETNPLLRWQSQNVILVHDTNGNVKPDKDKESQKIDGIIALIMAIGCSIQEKSNEKKPVEVKTQFLL